MTFLPIQRWAAAGVIAGVFALSGCGSDGEKSAAATPTRSPAATATPEKVASVPASLRGSWTRLMTRRDWKPLGSGYPLGTWRFDVDRRGGLRVYLPRKDTIDFETEFVVAGEQLTIETIPVCPGITGRYKWRASARKLTLTVVEDDDCAARAALFGGTWRRRH